MAIHNGIIGEPSGFPLKSVIIVNNGMVPAPGPEIPMEPPSPGRTVDVRRGRPRKAQSEARMQEVLQLYFVERLSMRKIAEVMGVSHMSVYRMLSDPNIEVLL